MCAAVRGRITTCSSPSSDLDCRWRSPRNSTPGGKSGIRRATRAGSTTACCRASGPRWSRPGQARAPFAAHSQRRRGRDRRRLSRAARRRGRGGMHRKLVPGQRPELRGLDRAGTLLGRLSGRAVRGLSRLLFLVILGRRAAAIRGPREHDHHDSWVLGSRFARPRMTGEGKALFSPSGEPAPRPRPR